LRKYKDKESYVSREKDYNIYYMPAVSYSDVLREIGRMTKKTA